MTTALEAGLLAKPDWTVDDLASLPEDLRYELIDGRLVLVTPTGLLQYFGRLIANALDEHCPDGYLPVQDVSLSVDFRNRRVPDVVVLNDRFIGRNPAPVEQAILVVEIISPSSAQIDKQTKKQVYAAAGVAAYWVVDPKPTAGVALTEYRLGERGRYEEVSFTDRVFTTTVPYPVTIDLPALTLRRDKYKS